MKKSARTLQCRNVVSWMNVLHFLCLFGPLLYYIPHAFVCGEPGQKLCLSLLSIVALCLGLLMIIIDASKRAGFAKTIMWILVLGIAICLEQAKIFICIMAVVAIIDELIIVRIRDKYKTALAANKEIDRRA